MREPTVQPRRLRVTPIYRNQSRKVEGIKTGCYEMSKSRTSRIRKQGHNCTEVSKELAASVWSIVQVLLLDYHEDAGSTILRNTNPHVTIYRALYIRRRQTFDKDRFRLRSCCWYKKGILSDSQWSHVQIMWTRALCGIPFSGLATSSQVV